MTIAALAKKFHLEVTRDGYDKIIQGARGYLYIDAGEVCAMWINANIDIGQLKNLGQVIWVGDLTLEPRAGAGRLRDAKVTGIPAENYARAIHLIGASGKRPKETERNRRKPKETK
jgi:hypothetical protein